MGGSPERASKGGGRGWKEVETRARRKVEVERRGRKIGAPRGTMGSRCDRRQRGSCFRHGVPILSLSAILSRALLCPFLLVAKNP